MISNIKIIIIILLCLLCSFKIVFADDDQLFQDIFSKQTLKMKRDYEYVKNSKKRNNKINSSNNCVYVKSSNISHKKSNWFSNIFKKNQKVSTNNNDVCKEIDLYNRLVKSFKLESNFNHPLVSYYEAYYFNHKNNFERNLERSSSYISYILDELKKRNMPGEIALLPMIESSYRGTAVSKVGATGMWQFMSVTGKNYGLNQTNWYDGRKDFYASTQAALNYLQDLYRQFSNWQLAICAYNVGENRVAREIEKAVENGLDPNFGNLNLPRETLHYLPKLIATRNFIINHKFYDLDLNSLDHPSKFVAISIKSPIDLEVVSELSQLDVDSIKELNYGYKIPVILPGKNRKLILPLENAQKFENNLKDYDSNKLSKWMAYKVLNKENILNISKKYNTSLIQLRYINNIYSRYISPGKVILIPKNNLNNFLDQYDDTLLSLEDAEYDIKNINNFNRIQFRSNNRKHKISKSRSHKTHKKTGKKSSKNKISKISSNKSKK